MAERKILISIVTTKQTAEYDWRKQMERMNKLGLVETALFLTCLELNERKKLYESLERSGIKSIPLVHIRNDMAMAELDYFVENYDTKFFCTHSASEFPFLHNCQKYKEIILIENTCNNPLAEKEIKNFGGICLDITHLENDRLLDEETFNKNTDILGRFPIVSNHVGSIRNVSYIDNKSEKTYHYHYLKNLSELDYLKRYPLSYFSSFVALELENGIQEQLKIKDYIEKLLAAKQ